ncbi:MAG: SLBB domain-containing protein [Capnocytophaga sp.]|nr:SLBB domain-containing protein [Capnocytophaga sp.]
MTRITFFIALLLTSIQTPAVIAQTTSPSAADIQQISNMNVDNLSDEQIRTYWNKAQQEGYTLDQVITMAQSRGMSSMQAMKLRQRIMQLSTSSTNNDTSFTEKKRIAKDERNDAFGYTGYENKDSLLLFKNKKDSIFGYSFFNNPNISFTPNTNMATPDNYQVGIGDKLLIEVWGATESSSEQTVDNQGTIFLNGIGKVNVLGLPFNQVKAKINSALKRIYAGISAPENSYNKVYTGVSISQIRTVKVNIIGEVKVPGTYSLSSLSTVLNALYASGGPTENGSFREINLVRNGQKIATFDIYSFLIKGSEEGNLTLQDQDVIIVPPYINRVWAEGEVKRPGAYETKENETLANLISYFGGFTSDAYTNTLVIERIKEAKREVKEVAFDNINSFPIVSGDRLNVHKITDEYQNKLSIGGAVYQPGNYEFKEGMTAFDLLQRANGVRKEASLERGIIFRSTNRVDVETINFSVKDLIEQKNNVSLIANDSLHVFHKDSLRFERIVKINGAVNKPKTIPYMENMTIDDVIVLAGGLAQGADANMVDILRETNNGNFESFSRSIKTSMNTNDASEILHPNDVVTVRYMIGYTPLQTISVKGEVMFPGEYNLSSKQERISDLVAKAGGFTPFAYVKGATLVRRKTEEAEKQQEDFLKELASDDESIKKIEKTVNEFRIGIDLQKIIDKKGSKYDLFLTEGDELIIPTERQTVEVKGEVLVPSLVRYEKGMNLRDYISGAGGFSNEAKKNSVYVMYANGTIKATKNSLFFKNYPELEPGAIIIVPTRPERKPLSTGETISIFTALTTMGVLIYNAIK